MMREGLTGKVVITNLLARDYPEIVTSIAANCDELTLLDGANDYWCRDYLPVQVNQDKFIQFTFDPDYYKFPCFTHLKTNVDSLKRCFGSKPLKSHILLDGGNIVYYDRKAIVTDSIFKYNSDIQKTTLINQLLDLLELYDLVIIPTLPYDITGHADGMVRFVNEHTLLINNFSKACSPTYWNRLLKSLKGFELCLLQNDSHLNKTTDDATGDYINMLATNDNLFIPVYGNKTDDLAIKIIEMAYSGQKIVPIPVSRLTTKGGGLHCASWNML
jgi:agmatine deiminase